MKSLITPSPKVTMALLLLSLCLLQPRLLWAQSKEKSKSKNAKDKTVHIRIEKEVNGKKEVYERTYNADEKNQEAGKAFFYSFPEPMGEELEEMVENEHFLKGRNSHDKFFFHFPTDSAQNRFFHLQQSDLDSLTKEQKQLFKHFRMDFNDKLAQSFPFNALHPPLPPMLPQGLLFDNPPFPPLEPFHERFEFDENKYDLQEQQTNHGKKYLITPKKRPERWESISENTSSSIQHLRISFTEKGLFNLSFDLPSKGNVVIRVTNIQGKKVLEEKLKEIEGHYRHQLNLSKQSAGTYFITITQNNDGLVERIVIR